MKFDSYTLQARYVPTILTGLPLIIFTAFIKEDVWIELFSNVEYFLVLENISIFMILLYGLTNFQRAVGKHFFEARVFNNGEDFPTTTFLLHSDNFLSSSIKQKLRTKINNDYDIRILSSSEENDDISQAKKTIRDAVNLIRKTVKNGNKTLQYNIHYGLVRNFIAGSIIAIFISLINIYKFYNINSVGLMLSIVFLVVYLSCIIFHKTILLCFARAYAECLLTEYLTIKKEA